MRRCAAPGRQVHDRLWLEPETGLDQRREPRAVGRRQQRPGGEGRRQQTALEPRLPTAEFHGQGQRPVRFGTRAATLEPQPHQSRGAVGPRGAQRQRLQVQTLGVREPCIGRDRRQGRIGRGPLQQGGLGGAKVRRQRVQPARPADVGPGRGEPRRRRIGAGRHQPLSTIVQHAGRPPGQRPEQQRGHQQSGQQASDARRGNRRADSA